MSSPGSRFGGGAGAAFSNSFAQTLIQGSQLIEANRQKGEELDLQKKLAQANLQKHEAEMGILQRQAQGYSDLQSRLTSQSWPDSELGAGGSTTPAPIGREEGIRLLAKIDPKAALTTALDPKQDIRALAGDFFKGNGTALASGGPPSGGTQKVAGPGGGGAAPTGDLGPQPKLERTLTIDSDGKLSFKLADRNVQYKIDHQTMVDPQTGKATVYRIITDPEDPQRSQILPMGRALPPEAIQKLDLAASSFGLRAGTPLHEAAVADLAAVSILQGPTQQQALIAIETKYRQLATDPKLNPPESLPVTVGGKPAASTGGIAAGATAAANAQEVAQARAKAKAEAEARQSVPEKASGAERDKLSSMLTASDLYGQIKGLYKKDYVGPLRGGAGATAYEKLGSMSQQEQQFRTAVTTANNQMIKDITGAQMSESEAARLLRQMPDPTLPANQFEARLKQTQINQKILAIRRRQVLEATGVDVSKVPAVSLTTEERRDVIAPIGQDYAMGQISREEAVSQLRGLAGYSETGAHAFLTAIKGGVR